jgi:hypothetical protein
LALEAHDTLSLFQALKTVGSKVGLDFSSLDPSIFFAQKDGLLRQKDILEYEAKLKTALIELPSEHDDDGKAKSHSNLVLDVVSQLQDPVLKKLGSNLDKAPTRASFTDNLIHLLADLHVQNELVRRCTRCFPAIPSC